MNRAIALLPLFACVGCVTAEPPVAANLDALALSAPAPSSEAAPTARAKTPSASVQLPSEAARIAGVERRWQADGYSEHVRLKTDAQAPESRIELAIRTRGAAASTPSDEAIRSELAREFPGVPMRIAPGPRYQNAYGDFGLAIGRSGDSLRCIYVWQSIDDARQTLPNGDHLSGKASEPAPASLRMKLCRSDMTVDQLADAAAHIEIALPDHAELATRPVASADRQDPRGEANSEPPAPTKRRTSASPAKLASSKPPPRIYAPAPAFAALPVAAAPEGQRFGARPPGGSSTTYAAVASSYGAPPSTVSSAAPMRTGAAYDLPPEAFAGPTDTTQR